MSTDLHDALRDLAEDIGPEEVPAGIAQRAWGAADLDRRRSRRTRALGALAAAAAIALVFWLAAGAGVGRVDSSPAGGTSSVGLPQRLTWQEDPPDLPTTGAPLAGLVKVGSAGAAQDAYASRATVNGGTSWQAFTADGRLWSLAGPVAPEPTDLAVDQEVTVTAPPAISPDGRRVAVARAVSRVVYEDSTSKETQALRQLIDVHDVVTGEHWRHDDVCGGECTLSSLRWDGSGRGLAALAHEPQGASLLLWFPQDTDPALHEVLLGDVAPRVELLGWPDPFRVLLTEVTESGSPVVRGRLRPLEVGTSWRSVRRLPTQEVRPSPKGEEPLAPALLGDEIALLDPPAEGRLTWQTYAQPEPSGVDSGVSVPDPTGTIVDGQTEQPRLVEARGGLLVALPRGVLHTSLQDGDKVLTVVDPRLHPQDLLVAGYAERGQAATSILGTRTSWWSWRPGLAVSLAATPFALVTTGLLIRHVARRRRPTS